MGFNSASDWLRINSLCFELLAISRSSTGGAVRRALGEREKNEGGWEGLTRKDLKEFLVEMEAYRLLPKVF